MNQTLRKKVKNYLAFLFIGCMIAGAAYLVVYKFSFLPNGYEIEAIQNNSISLKSYNVIGIEKAMTTVSFSEEDSWKIDEIVYEVNRQKEFLWLLFLSMAFSIILFIYKIRNGSKFWRGVYESRIIFSGLPLYIVMTTLNRIRDIIS